MLTSPTSDWGSTATTVAASRRPVEVVAMIHCALASKVAFVAISPSAATTMPQP